MSALAAAVIKYSQYAEAWTKDANYYFDNGFYHWMEQQIHDRKSVLEIGCGTGASTEVLLNGGHQVVSIEENPSCIEATYLRLRKKFRVKKIRRSKLVNHEDKFGILYFDIPPIYKDYDLILIDANITLEDPHLLDYLNHQTFDVVICWLIGTDGYTRCNTIDEQNTKSFDPTDYRFMVQNRIYDLSANWLTKDGVLHFVDRGFRTRDPMQVRAYQESHVHQASTTPFIIQEGSHVFIDYDPKQIIDGIKMGYSTEGVESVGDSPIPVLHAIKARMRLGDA